MVFPSFGGRGRRVQHGFSLVPAGGKLIDHGIRTFHSQPVNGRVDDGFDKLTEQTSRPETAMLGSAGVTSPRSGSIERNASSNRISARCSETAFTVPTPYWGCLTRKPTVRDCIFIAPQFKHPDRQCHGFLLLLRGPWDRLHNKGPLSPTLSPSEGEREKYRQAALYCKPQTPQ